MADNRSVPCQVLGSFYPSVFYIFAECLLCTELLEGLPAKGFAPQQNREACTHSGPITRHNQDFGISGKGALFFLQGKGSGKASLRRYWGLLATDVILQDEEWASKLRCAEWPDRDGPFLATQHKAGSKPGLGEAASLSGFPHC